MRRFERETADISGTVGGYQVESAVRSTAGRTVYSVRRTEPGRRVELHVSHEDQEEFLTHAHRLTALKDPYLLPVYEVGVHDGHAFAAAASPGRETLEERLRSGPIPVQRALRLAGDLVTPLETLERAGLSIGEIPESAVALQGERALLAPLEIEGPERPQDDESSGVALAGMLRSMIGNDVPEELEALLADPPESAGELLERARNVSTRSPRRPPPRVPLKRVAVGLAGLAALATAVILLAGGDTREAQPGAPSAAAGKIAATIPLGAEPTSVAFDGNAIWVGTTAGSLIRVDPATNRVVGAPIEVTGEDVTDGTVTAGAGAVFLITGNRLHRIDPATGEVTARRQIDGRALSATVAGGQ
ncbi:MAG: eukaryotic-like serine/threonine-protein kinase, partial [Solirubrobacteraceae bacterium]|nr:eukaryotic-like serine/threonine-protein kinase [Solirubrobacteraceae bacterium]